MYMCMHICICIYIVPVFKFILQNGMSVFAFNRALMTWQGRVFAQIVDGISFSARQEPPGPLQPPSTPSNVSLVVTLYHFYLLSLL